MFSELKNESILSTFIVSPPVYLHTAFLDDFFGVFFSYAQVETMSLWRTCGESSPLSKETSRVGTQKLRASSDMNQTLVVCEMSHREMDVMAASEQSVLLKEENV